MYKAYLPVLSKIFQTVIAKQEQIEQLLSLVQGLLEARKWLTGYSYVKSDMIPDLDNMLVQLLGKMRSICEKNSPMLASDLQQLENAFARCHERGYLFLQVEITFYLDNKLIDKALWLLRQVLNDNDRWSNSEESKEVAKLTVAKLLLGDSDIEKGLLNNLLSGYKLTVEEAPKVNDKLTRAILALAFVSSYDSVPAKEIKQAILEVLKEEVKDKPGMPYGKLPEATGVL